MEKRKLVLGILAHVDAGKTTLSEALLYRCGKIRKLGRVDTKDAYLDTNDMERERGITIFSKQAVFQMGDTEVTLLDTPGHVDFSSEMERTLQVLDYAILVISGADGVQGHTLTLWKLLERYEIPTFIFINKMDQPATDAEHILHNLKQELDDACISFEEEDDTFYEAIAMCREDWMDTYLEQGEIPLEEIQEGIWNRQIFPCFFGSALKIEGIDAFTAGMDNYMVEPEYPREFAAKVYKISRDDSKNRLTHIKVTGGELRVRQTLSGKDASGEEWSEKVNQIRVYSGEKYESVEVAKAGMICSVTGLSKTYAGQGLGMEEDSEIPWTTAALNYRMILPKGFTSAEILPKLRILEEEDPTLKVVWKEELQEIQVQLMGEVQIEVIRRMIHERFGVAVEFGAGRIVYKETVANTVEGVGHFEPLRHYAEVHLLIEPGEPGSGIEVASACSEEQLDKNWQRLISTHILEKEHAGVLTGSALTDVKITIVNGKAHLKHTEGGDFRQATYRAIRQGLMKAENVILEPYYSFRLEVPADMLGRAMTDVEKMCGKFSAPEQKGECSILSGMAPVATMQNYQKEIHSYTKGAGKINLSMKGYYPCHNAKEVWEASGYDPETDLANPTGSVFCSHGAGYVVPWHEVEQHMHLPLSLGEEKISEEEIWKVEGIKRAPKPADDYFMGEEEVNRIIGKISHSNRKNEKKHPYKKYKRVVETPKLSNKVSKNPVEKYLLVDGYNIVFAWDELRELAKDNIDAARNRLMDILCNYQGFKKMTLILVFDAYKVKGNIGEMSSYHNIHVVYTKEAETADQYIEKLAHKIGRDYDVTVATSDGLEQLIIRGQGCRLLSARDFYEEIKRTEEQISGMISKS